MNGTFELVVWLERYYFCAFSVHANDYSIYHSHTLLSACAYIPTGRKLAPNNKVCLILNRILHLNFFHSIGPENDFIKSKLTYRNGYNFSASKSVDGNV